MTGSGSRRRQISPLLRCLPPISMGKSGQRDSEEGNMTPIRNERQEIIGYRQEQADGRVTVRTKHGELVGWTAFGQTRRADGALVSFQDNEGLLYRELR